MKDKSLKDLHVKAINSFTHLKNINDVVCGKEGDNITNKVFPFHKSLGVKNNVRLNMKRSGN